MLERLAGESYFAGLDKLAHLGEFALLYVLLWNALARSRIEDSAIWALWLGMGFAVIDELHQAMLTYRSCQIGDLVGDWCGVILMYFLVEYYRRGQLRNL